MSRPSGLMFPSMFPPFGNINPTHNNRYSNSSLFDQSTFLILQPQESKVQYVPQQKNMLYPLRLSQSRIWHCLISRQDLTTFHFSVAHRGGRFFLPSQKRAGDAIDNGSTRNVSSKADAGDRNVKYVYVHPLSQIVLECLQSNYHEWLVRRQLHCNSLSLHRDGTFEIKFPRYRECRIWTNFDDHDKKHWLTVKRETLVRRYLLQDNLKSAWHGDRKGSLPERIHVIVKEMAEEIEGFERRNTRGY